MLEKLTSKDFSPYLNEKFHIHSELSDTVEAELIDISEHGPDEKESPKRKRRTFSIVLECPPGDVMPQMIYKVEHEKLGMMDLFLVPVDADEKGVRYEAVFT